MKGEGLRGVQGKRKLKDRGALWIELKEIGMEWALMVFEKVLVAVTRGAVVEVEMEVEMEVEEEEVVVVEDTMEGSDVSL